MMAKFSDLFLDATKDGYKIPKENYYPKVNTRSLTRGRNILRDIQITRKDYMKTSLPLFLETTQELLNMLTGRAFLALTE